MVRELKKPSKGIQELEAMEKEVNADIAKINKEMADTFKSELDGGFFFSVVFNNREERDEWLKNHKLKLEDDYFIKASDFNL
jgi:hypothetical protein